VLVRISDTVVSLFFPQQKNLEFLIEQTSQRNPGSEEEKKVFIEVRPIIAQFLASFKFSNL
jgi:hypothetical protein